MLARLPSVATRPALAVSGMLGVGDNLHQRAVLRELMKTNDVWLESYYAAMFHDLIADGLKIVPRHKPGRIREATRMPRHAGPPRATLTRKVTYDRHKTLAHNSVLAAQFESVGLKAPAKPDFSLPVPEAWRMAARRQVLSRNTTGKPVMVYRPIVLNKTWNCPARSPDWLAYDALFSAIRGRFFVVSVANLKPNDEWIVGPRPDVDLRLERGELDFETMTGLFAEADMVFGNAGFTPILAQAVGTPNIVVYGGNEGFEETNACGAHLAPTLAIEPDKPCRCHLRFHDCDKTITLEPAIERIEAFVAEHVDMSVSPAVVADKPRTLIFATTYVDTQERARLTKQWADVHKTLNPDCDFLIVDSASPLIDADTIEWNGAPIHQMGDNIGHLSRGGRDGWGRAFCKGLEHAIEHGYDYAVHIEGDSLFRRSVMPIVQQMQRDGTKVASVPVEGTKRKEIGWVETGLMFFDVNYLKSTDFIAKYDWPNRKERPTPEKVIFNILGRDLKMMPWKAERGDKSQITVDNVCDLDWVTHCHGQPEIYDRFVDGVLGKQAAPVAQPVVKLNFGCGKNHIDGWQNYDAELDISNPLPFERDSADYILAEHVIEHVDYYKAVNFLKECARVLKPWGVIRVSVPSIERIWKHATPGYLNFVRRWAPTHDVRGAMHAILYEHGHQTAWTDSLMEATLFYCGFKNITRCEPSKSLHGPLVDVDGHPKAIGTEMNWIESVVFEAEAEKG
jgi:hypothetical protein